MMDAKRRLATVTVLMALFMGPTAWGAVWYVSTSGSASGDGSCANPWDITTAFNAPAVVKPGDTLLLRGGTYGTGGSCVYMCYLMGEEDKPICIRSYPGETAVIDGGVDCTTDGSLNDLCRYVIFWDLEIMNSSSLRVGSRTDRTSPVHLNATGCGVRNLVIHDGGHPAIGLWNGAKSSEVYGTLIWGCGIICSDPGYDYCLAGSAIYTGSKYGTKSIEQCIVFRNYTHGIKPYATSDQVRGYRIFDNTSFDTFAGSNIKVGDSDSNTLTADMQICRNYTYRKPASSGVENITLGINGDNGDVLVADNYFVGGKAEGVEEEGVVHFRKWDDFEFTGNTVAGTGTLVWFQQMSGYTSEVWNNNRYFGGAPLPFFHTNDDEYYDWSDWKTATGFDSSSTYDSVYPSEVKTLVTANKYASGRGNVTVYNFLGNPTVNVDVSNVIRTGEYYEVRDAQNYFGSVVTSGTYNGATISLPMNQTTVAQPIGTGLPDGYEESFVTTAPYFGAFVITAPNRNTVWIEASDRDAGEDGPTTGEFTVHRTGGTTSALTVYYTVSGTATASDDYSTLSGSVTIASSETTATVTITPVDDAVEEAAETVIMRLIPHDTDYAVDQGCFADTVIIADDDGQNDGLLVHWKLDETTGTVAIDSGPMANHMKVIDGTWTTSGIIGGAMDLDNTDDYLLGAPVLANRSAYTLAAWFKTETSDTDRIYSEYSTTTGTPLVGVRVDSYGRIIFTHRDDADNIVQAVTGYIGVNDGSWHHVVCVRDGGTLTIYCDTEQVATETDTSPGTTTVEGSCIGAFYYNTTSSFTHVFDGTLDDIRLYDYAMETGDIDSLYEATFDTEAPTAPTNLALTDLDACTASFSWSASTDDTGVAGYVLYRDGVAVCSTDGTTGSDAGLPDSTAFSYTVKAYDDAGNFSAASSALEVTNGGLLSHWKLDETTGSTAADSGPAENDGAVTGGTWEEEGKIRGALTFDGDDYVLADASLAINERYALSVWFRTEATNEVVVYSERNSGDATPNFFISVNYIAGRIRFYHKDDAGTTLSRLLKNPDASYITNANNGTWHHLVVVRNGDDSFVFYYDGIESDSKTGITLGATTMNVASIGATYSTSPNKEFEGEIDDVRVFDRSLTPEEAANLYAEGDDYSYTDLQAPTAPSSLAVTNVTTSGASLSWSATTDNVAVTGYRVFRDWELIETTTNLTYTDSGLDGGTFFTYHVVAIDAAGNISDADCAETHTLLDPDDTVGCWALDDGSGSTADDASPTENDGALSGGPSWTGNGVVDGALTFDGTDDYVAMDSSLGGNTTYTLSLWFKTTATTETYLYNERNTGDSTPNIFLSVNYGSEGRLRFYHKGDGATTLSTVLRQPDDSYIEDANDGEWHHLVIVRDAADSFLFYYDGELSYTKTGIDPGTTTMNIATLGASRVTTANKFFNGTIDQVRIYDEAVSDDTIKCLCIEPEE